VKPPLYYIYNRALVWKPSQIHKSQGFYEYVRLTKPSNIEIV
jgi:hypothetical protein